MALAQKVGRGMRIALLFFLCAIGAPAANYYVTVAGLGGAPEYETQFTKWAADLERELKANGPATQVITLSGANATRAQIDQQFGRLATEIQPDDTFALFLIGHGSFDGVDYKMNLPGPDMTAAQLAELLSRIPAQRQLVVNMTSCSGASLAALTKKDRVVITATKSGTEKNAPIFARYWVDALRDSAADTDKNGVISALEAYRYADRKTAAYFEAEKLLATEHSRLADAGQGLLAASFTLIRPPTETTNAGSPEKQRLLARKEDLEAKIDRLKYQKAAMPEDEYKQQLTELLLDLARTQAELDK
jgi:peptidase C13-like protein